LQKNQNKKTAERKTVKKWVKNARDTNFNNYINWHSRLSRTGFLAISLSVCKRFPKMSFAKYNGGIVFVVLFDIHSRTRLGGNWIAEVCGTVGTWNDGGCGGGGTVVVGDRRLSNVLYLDLCKIRGSLTGDYLCGTCFILFIIIFHSFLLFLFLFLLRNVGCVRWTWKCLGVRKYTYNRQKRNTLTMRGFKKLNEHFND